MKIVNARTGFANNSSSTHSIVWIDKRVADNMECDDYQYGWENFTLTSAGAKAAYLTTQLYENLRHQMPDKMAATIAKEWGGDSAFNPEGHFDAYVDHQSVWDLPVEWDGRGPNLKFIEDLADYLRRDDVAVLGGNDNSDDHPLAEQFPRGIILPEEGRSEHVARRDGIWWTLFNRHNGTKIRLSFERDPGKYVKASAPELVDVKITDFCPYNCAYCYMGSTVAGKHADNRYLEQLALQLGRLHVFEVAIGGGEPTLSPHLLAFMSSLREAGVVPNFTTRNTNWLSSEDGQKALKLCGSVAVSVDTEADVERAKRHLQKAGCWQYSFQVVMGSMASWQFARLLRAIGQDQVTLLGYKTTGRGGDQPPQPYGWWLDEVSKHADGRWVRVGIDTVMAEQFASELEARKVPAVLVHGLEGTHSMYVDAVEQKCGVSSFADEYEPLPSVRHLQAKFQAMEPLQ